MGGVWQGGVDINDIKGKYDKLIYSFMGVCGSGVGDPTVTSSVSSVAGVCAANNYPDYTIVFTDPNSDYQIDYGSGSGSGHWNSELQGAASFESGQKYAGALIAVLRDMKRDDPNLELAFSVGGWSEKDGENYALLIKELRTALTKAGIPEKKVAMTN